MPLEKRAYADEGLFVETLQCVVAFDGSTEGFVEGISSPAVHHSDRSAMAHFLRVV
jgi:hypothetical protein